MKNFLFLSLLLLCSISYAQTDLSGAYQWEGTDDEGNPIVAIAILADNFYSDSWYDLANKKFIRTKGGSYSFDGKMLTETIEFDTRDSTAVGTTNRQEISIDGDVVTFISSGNQWTKIDDGSPGDLAGAWLISGRMRDGEIQERNTDRPRKTMKILSGTRFQWIAYNTETKEFMGTGGGTYTSENGKYVENIGFFSRDDSRVGASLSFDFKLEDGKWHHSGKSSKGSPIYEIWSPRKL